jgi:polyphosphate kinase
MTESRKSTPEGDPVTRLGPRRPATATGPRRFINRELSWLAFNTRVLEEASNTTYPLLERLNFLAISAINLNEFYMVRVAGLKGQVRAGITEASADGLSPVRQLDAVRDEGARLMARQNACWWQLVGELAKVDIVVYTEPDLRKVDRDRLEQQFMDDVFPVLTPIAVDPDQPFPFIPNLGLSLIMRLERPGEDAPLTTLLPVPPQLDRFMRLPGPGSRFIPMEAVIRLFAELVFPGCRIVASGCFRVLRDSELEIEEEAEDLVRTFETALKRRRRGTIIRLSHDIAMAGDLRDVVMMGLGVEPADSIAIDGLLGLADTREIVRHGGPNLRLPALHPRRSSAVTKAGGDMFAAIRHGDILVHHPYESFESVIDFVRQAAMDPDVVAIKQTLYRTSDDSPIVAALIEAARAGKSVTAVVELKARFHEEANIRWARDLERAGAQVLHGFIDKKTHAKVNLVVRQEGSGLVSYVHYGTGNYHPETARVYTDLSLFSCDQAICRDAARIFNLMTGDATPEAMEKISFSPDTLAPTLTKMIDDEAENARSGKPAAIWAKLNSLVDPDIIDALYAASKAGVEIDLVVRGICCLRPGLAGLSETIRVKSIVGRFLEHARIICFANGHMLPSPRARIYISSADWMPRNLYQRIETLVPIEDTGIHHRILDGIMVANLRDDARSWRLDGDGRYHRIVDGEGFCVYDHFMAPPSAREGKIEERVLGGTEGKSSA